MKRNRKDKPNRTNLPNLKKINPIPKEKFLGTNPEYEALALLSMLEFEEVISHQKIPEGSLEMVETLDKETGKWKRVI